MTVHPANLMGYAYVGINLVKKWFFKLVGHRSDR
ncbi:hypothetical protein BN8_00214 [Fibrisoma limi BUZ 3]|uniref:Uncharacterized protein n=1 Tax=Fibrisoma limi BUZ 3 TaxID=1185876 RepID=I2GBM3_9BACT|nr:hypothetical protein BN8_00214 [Fibrisoma limi BUZ 3]